jgi:thiol-disulfide isomerase/thioredoxin
MKCFQTIIAISLFMFLLPNKVVSQGAVQKAPKHQIANKKKAFKVDAEIKGMTSKYLLYYKENEKASNGYSTDTIWVKEGKFTLIDSTTTYKICYLNVPEALRKYKVKYGDKEYGVSVKAHLSRLWFIGYPGAEITYKGNIEEFMVNAYPSDKKGINNDLALINSQIFPLMNQMDSISVASTTGNFSDEIKKEMYEKQLKIGEKVKELKINFIKSHPSSIAASYIFNDAYYRNYFTHDQAKSLLYGFDRVKLGNTPFLVEVEQRILAKEKTGIGMNAPDILTSNTIDNSEFKLSSLRGKYVLLDFWGTWCGPCMGEMPKIKEYYNKYSAKNFIVLGVNSGDTAEKWKNSIKNNDFNWSHIRTTKENDLLIPFNVRSFPTKILIDPNGVIIYSSNNAEGKVDLYQMLDTIFSKS